MTYDLGQKKKKTAKGQISRPNVFLLVSNERGAPKLLFGGGCSDDHFFYYKICYHTYRAALASFLLRYLISNKLLSIKELPVPLGKNKMHSNNSRKLHRDTYKYISTIVKRKKDLNRK